MTLGEQAVIKELLSLAGALYSALDDSEEIDGGNYVIDAKNIQRLLEIVEELDSLPDDRPGYIMSYPAKAAWALRRILELEKTKI